MHVTDLTQKITSQKVISDSVSDIVTSSAGRTLFCLDAVPAVCIRDMIVLLRSGVISHKPYALQFTKQMRTFAVQINQKRVNMYLIFGGDILFSDLLCCVFDTKTFNNLAALTEVTFSFQLLISWTLIYSRDTCTERLIISQQCDSSTRDI